MLLMRKPRLFLKNVGASMRLIRLQWSIVIRDDRPGRRALRWSSRFTHEIIQRFLRNAGNIERVEVVHSTLESNDPDAVYRYQRFHKLIYGCQYPVKLAL